MLLPSQSKNQEGQTVGKYFLFPPPLKKIKLKKLINKIKNSLKCIDFVLFECQTSDRGIGPVRARATQLYVRNEI